MKIINSHQITPDFLSSLETDKNIIMVVHPNHKNIITESKSFPDRLQIRLSKDINLSSNDIINISTSALSTTIRPNLKISYPVGILINFSEFMENPNQDVFWKMYKSCDSWLAYKNDNIGDHNIIENIKFVMYMDTIQMRESGLQMILRENTPIIDFYFTYYIQTVKEMAPIENIYLIIDDQVYSDFVNIF